jgi:hypothetical protein
MLGSASLAAVNRPSKAFLLGLYPAVECPGAGGSYPHTDEFSSGIVRTFEDDRLAGT